VGALIAEDAVIIADAYTLVGAEIDISGAELTVGLREIFADNQHADGFVANRGELVELCGRLIGGRRALLEGTNEVAALEITASEGNFSSGDIGLDVDDLELAGVPVEGTHGFSELVLPLEPLDVVGIGVGARDSEAIANTNALARALVDIHVVAETKDDSGVGLFAGNKERIVTAAIRGVVVRAVNGGVIRGDRGGDRRGLRVVLCRGAGANK